MSIILWWRNRGRDFSKFPADENGEVLWQMHKGGDDLSLQRRMDFVFLFPSEHCARAFQPKAERLGFDVEVSFFAEKRSWDAQCSMDMVPTHQAVSSVEGKLSEMAALDNGRPDGWGSFAQ
ncbi:MAG: ribonuclease E inhibitor RraB [Pseudomonadota bacterium]